MVGILLCNDPRLLASRIPPFVNIDHNHLLQLLGATSPQEPEVNRYYIIIEESDDGQLAHSL